MKLRKHINNKRLEKIEQMGVDRVVGIFCFLFAFICLLAATPLEAAWGLLKLRRGLDPPSPHSQLKFSYESKRFGGGGVIFSMWTLPKIVINLQSQMRSYPVKENLIGSVVSETLRYTDT